MAVEKVPCNVCARYMERYVQPGHVHRQFSMCGACAKSYRRDLYNEGLIDSNTKLEAGFSWLTLESINKLMQLFPNAMAIPEAPPTLQSFPDIEFTEEDFDLQAPIKVPEPEFCKKAYYGVGTCTCGECRVSKRQNYNRDAFGYKVQK